MKVKTSELTGDALDWAVAKCEVLQVTYDGIAYVVNAPDRVRWLGARRKRCAKYSPSTDWESGGPIIEREHIYIRPTITEGGYRTAHSFDAVEAKIELPAGSTTYDPHAVVFEYGPTPLIAAMRAYVASKLGDTVDVPAELLK